MQMQSGRVCTCQKAGLSCVTQAIAGAAGLLRAMVDRRTTALPIAVFGLYLTRGDPVPLEMELKHSRTKRPFEGHMMADDP